VGSHDPPEERWRSLGWSVVDPRTVSASLEEYRAYLEGSRGEFSVAKNLYAATRSGWFSCRSVCYLAAGGPFVLQDTGFSEFLPTGAGLLAYSTLDEAVEAVAAVERDYPRHQEAARETARACFGSDQVLRRLLQEIGISRPAS